MSLLLQTIRTTLALTGRGARGPRGANGAAGGNVMAIGLFTGAAGMTIPSGTPAVRTAGHHSEGVGIADYYYDAAVDASYVASHPNTSFVAADGRGFRLSRQPFVDAAKLGIKADNATDDTLAWQRAIALSVVDGFAISFVGRSIVNDTLIDDAAYTELLRIAGAGPSLSQFVNGALGKTLLPIGNSYWTQLENFAIAGNGLTGASGNGHAISMVDPSVGTGTFLPGQARLVNLNVQGHLGEGADYTGAAMPACGVYGAGALGAVTEKCDLSANMIGLWLMLCEQPSVLHCSLADNHLSGIVDVENECPSYLKNDLVNNDSQSGGTIHVQPLSGTPRAGNLVTFYSWGASILANKIKEHVYSGISIEGDNPPKIGTNWIRQGSSVGTTGVFARGAWIDIGNTFDRTGPTSAVDRRDVYTVLGGGLNDIGSIGRSSHRWGGGGSMAALIEVDGTAASAIHGEIGSAIFGGPLALANPLALTAGLKVAGTAGSLEIGNIRMHAANNVTCDTAFDFSGLTVVDFGLKLSDMRAINDGGSITTEITYPPSPYKVVISDRNGFKVRGGPSDDYITRTFDGTVATASAITINTTETFLGTVTFSGGVIKGKSTLRATCDQPADGLILSACWSSGASQAAAIYGRMVTGSTSLPSGTNIVVHGEERDG